MMETIHLSFSFMYMLLNYELCCSEAMEANGNAFHVDISACMLEGWIYGENLASEVDVVDFV